MKKLIFVTAVFAIGTAFSALPPAKDGDPDVVNTNGVEYTRRGTMSTKNYAVTDVDTDSMIRRGYNSIGVEEIDGEDSKYEQLPVRIWETAEICTNQVTGKIGVRFPVKTNDGDPVIIDGKQVYVFSGMKVSDNGWEFLTSNGGTSSEDFIYMAADTEGHMTNGSYCWGTNRNDKTKRDKFEFPKGSKRETVQNGNLIFCDRAWITNLIIKAGIDEADVITALNKL